MLENRDFQSFCTEHAFPPELRRRLMDHMEFSFHTLQVGETVTYELDSLLKDLGPQLRTETVLFLHR